MDGDPQKHGLCLQCTELIFLNLLLLKDSALVLQSGGNLTYDKGLCLVTFKTEKQNRISYISSNFTFIKAPKKPIVS